MKWNVNAECLIANHLCNHCLPKVCVIKLSHTSPSSEWFECWCTARPLMKLSSFCLFVLYPFVPVTLYNCPCFGLKVILIVLSAHHNWGSGQKHLMCLCTHILISVFFFCFFLVICSSSGVSCLIRKKPVSVQIFISTKQSHTLVY